MFMSFGYSDTMSIVWLISSPSCVSYVLHAFSCVAPIFMRFSHVLPDRADARRHLPTPASATSAILPSAARVLSIAVYVQ